MVLGDEYSIGLLLAEMLVGVDVGQQRQPCRRGYHEVEEALNHVVRGHVAVVLLKVAAYVLGRFLGFLARNLKEGEHYERKVSFKLAFRFLQLHHLFGHVLTVKRFHGGGHRTAYFIGNVHLLYTLLLLFWLQNYEKYVNSRV